MTLMRDTQNYQKLYDFLSNLPESHVRDQISDLLSSHANVSESNLKLELQYRQSIFDHATTQARLEDSLRQLDVKNQILQRMSQDSYSFLAVHASMRAKIEYLSAQLDSCQSLSSEPQGLSDQSLPSRSTKLFLPPSFLPTLKNETGKESSELDTLLKKQQDALKMSFALDQDPPLFKSPLESSTGNASKNFKSKNRQRFATTDSELLKLNENHLNNANEQNEMQSLQRRCTFLENELLRYKKHSQNCQSRLYRYSALMHDRFHEHVSNLDKSYSYLNSTCRDLASGYEKMLNALFSFQKTRRNCILCSRCYTPSSTRPSSSNDGDQSHSHRILYLESLIEFLVTREDSRWSETQKQLKVSFDQAIDCFKSTQQNLKLYTLLSESTLPVKLFPDLEVLEDDSPELTVESDNESDFQITIPPVVRQGSLVSISRALPSLDIRECMESLFHSENGSVFDFSELSSGNRVSYMVLKFVIRLLVTKIRRKPILSHVSTQSHIPELVDSGTNTSTKSIFLSIRDATSRVNVDPIVSIATAADTGASSSKSHTLNYKHDIRHIIIEPVMTEKMDAVTQSPEIRAPLDRVMTQSLVSLVSIDPTFPPKVKTNASQTSPQSWDLKAGRISFVPEIKSVHHFGTQTTLSAISSTNTFSLDGRNNNINHSASQTFLTLSKISTAPNQSVCIQPNIDAMGDLSSQGGYAVTPSPRVSSVIVNPIATNVLIKGNYSFESGLQAQEPQLKKDTSILQSKVDSPKKHSKRQDVNADVNQVNNLSFSMNLATIAIDPKDSSQRGVRHIVSNPDQSAQAIPYRNLSVLPYRNSLSVSYPVAVTTVVPGIPRTARLSRHDQVASVTFHPKKPVVIDADCQTSHLDRGVFVAKNLSYAKDVSVVDIARPLRPIYHCTTQTALPALVESYTQSDASFMPTGSVDDPIEVKNRNTQTTFFFGLDDDAQTIPSQPNLDRSGLLCKVDIVSPIWPVIDSINDVGLKTSGPVVFGPFNHSVIAPSTLPIDHFPRKLNYAITQTSMINETENLKFLLSANRLGPFHNLCELNISPSLRSINHFTTQTPETTRADKGNQATSRDDSKNLSIAHNLCPLVIQAPVRSIHHLTTQTAESSYNVQTTSIVAFPLHGVFRYEKAIQTEVKDLADLQSVQTEMHIAHPAHKSVQTPISSCTNVSTQTLMQKVEVINPATILVPRTISLRQSSNPLLVSRQTNTEYVLQNDTWVDSSKNDTDVAEVAVITDLSPPRDYVSTQTDVVAGERNAHGGTVRHDMTSQETQASCDTSSVYSQTLLVTASKACQTMLEFRSHLNESECALASLENTAIRLVKRISSDLRQEPIAFHPRIATQCATVSVQTQTLDRTESVESVLTQTKDSNYFVDIKQFDQLVDTLFSHFSKEHSSLTALLSWINESPTTTDALQISIATLKCYVDLIFKGLHLAKSATGQTLFIPLGAIAMLKDQIVKKNMSLAQDVTAFVKVYLKKTRRNEQVVLVRAEEALNRHLVAENEYWKRMAKHLVHEKSTLSHDILNKPKSAVTSITHQNARVKGPLVLDATTQTHSNSQPKPLVHRREVINHAVPSKITQKYSIATQTDIPDCSLADVCIQTRLTHKDMKSSRQRHLSRVQSHPILNDVSTQTQVPHDPQLTRNELVLSNKRATDLEQLLQKQKEQSVQEFTRVKSELRNLETRLRSALKVSSRWKFLAQDANLQLDALRQSKSDLSTRNIGTGTEVPDANGCDIATQTDVVGSDSCDPHKVQVALSMSSSKKSMVEAMRIANGSPCDSNLPNEDLIAQLNQIRAKLDIHKLQMRTNYTLLETEILIDMPAPTKKDVENRMGEHVIMEDTNILREITRNSLALTAHEVEKFWQFKQLLYRK